MHPQAEEEVNFLRKRLLSGAALEGGSGEYSIVLGCVMKAATKNVG